MGLVPVKDRDIRRKYDLLILSGGSGNFYDSVTYSQEHSALKETTLPIIATTQNQNILLFRLKIAPGWSEISEMSDREIQAYIRLSPSNLQSFQFRE